MKRLLKDFFSNLYHIVYKSNVFQKNTDININENNVSFIFIHMIPCIYVQNYLNIILIYFKTPTQKKASNIMDQKRIDLKGYLV